MPPARICFGVGSALPHKNGRTRMAHTTQPSITRKEAIWLACKQKSCCYASLVLLSGRDIWRISRSLDLPPATFMVYFETPRPTRDSFALDQSGRTFRLVLAKQKSRRRKNLPPPCIFLMKTRSGHHRCGLGSLRPQVCHSFPIERVGGVLCIPGETDCTCRDWSLADVDMEEEARELDSRQAGFEEYSEVVAHWNRTVADAQEGTVFTFLQFCDFLLAEYDRIDEEQARSATAAAVHVETAGAL